MIDYSMLKTIIIISAILGIVCSFVLYPVFYFFHTIFIAPFKAKKYIKEKKYNQVEATLCSGSLKPYENGQDSYTAVYEYIVDGKKYSKVISRDQFNYFNDKINLYYVSNPKKAVEGISNLGKIENSKEFRRKIWIITSITLFIIFAIIMIFYKR